MNVLASQMLTMTFLVVTMVESSYIQPQRGVGGDLQTFFQKKNYGRQIPVTVIKQFDDRFVRGFPPMNKPPSLVKGQKRDAVDRDKK